MAKKLHTGKTAIESGIYQIKGTKDEMILSKGDRVPPYDKKAVVVELVRKVKHNK